MIIDTLDHAEMYAPLGKGVARALKYLRDEDIAAKDPGRYDLDGDRLFLMVQEYDTRKRDGGVWEAHRKYIDLQFVISGAELMGRANLTSLSPHKTYDSDLDVELLDGDGDFVTVPADTFVLFYPQDAHMPCIAVKQTAPVRKAVFKIAAIG